MAVATPSSAAVPVTRSAAAFREGGASPHGDAVSGDLDHRQVHLRVAERDRFRERDAEGVAEAPEGWALAGGGTRDGDDLAPGTGERALGAQARVLHGCLKGAEGRVVGTCERCDHVGLVEGDVGQAGDDGRGSLCLRRRQPPKRSRRGTRDDTPVLRVAEFGDGARRSRWERCLGDRLAVRAADIGPRRRRRRR